MKSQRLGFERLNNTRDLGGMKAADGRTIRPGRLIRSGHLYACSDADKEALAEKVGLIVDFRTEQERLEKPDPDIAGVEYLHMPPFETLTSGVTREARADAALRELMFDPEGARGYMIDTYLGFARSERSHAVYRRFLELLTKPRDRATLWHCTAGKDRAGFASVLIERILGVDASDVMEDYLYTNECLSGEVEGLTGMIERSVGKSSPALRASIGWFFGAREEYLSAVYTEIDVLYGSFDGFLSNALGVGADMTETLRQLYLE